MGSNELFSKIFQGFLRVLGGIKKTQGKEVEKRGGGVTQEIWGGISILEAAMTKNRAKAKKGGGGKTAKESSEAYEGYIKKPMGIG